MIPNHEVLKKIVLTEETYNLVQRQHTFVFRVDQRRNKVEIRQAVEKAFGVRVTDVNTCIRPSKYKALRRKPGKFGVRPGGKKAYVKVHPDDVAKIPLI